VLAFFELPEQPDGPRSHTPAWVQHLAFEVEDEAALLAAKAISRRRASTCWGRPGTASSSRSISSIPTATGWNWRATSARPNSTPN
jgi:hypothetical protein